jgi:tRNA(fMet)-specific endonuclease VapC
MSNKYLLDTNICIYIAKYQPQSVRERFQQHHFSDLYLSVITLGELRFGAEKSQSKDKAMKVVQTLAKTMQIADLDEKVAVHYGDIRQQLQKKGQIIGNNDLWLAAHARANDWVMVTNNEKEFLRVDGLRVENWV